MFYFLVDLLNFSVYYNHSTPYRFISGNSFDP